MDKPDNELSDKQKQFIEFLDKASNKDSASCEQQLIKDIKENPSRYMNFSLIGGKKPFKAK